MPAGMAINSGLRAAAKAAVVPQFGQKRLVTVRPLSLT